MGTKPNSELTQCLITIDSTSVALFTCREPMKEVKNIPVMHVN